MSQPETWVPFGDDAIEKAHLSRTLITTRERIGYLALGLCGESSELMSSWLMMDEQGALEEAGDVGWYLAVLERESGLQIAWDDVGKLPFVEGGFCVGLLRAACDLAERAKRALIGGEFDRAKAAIVLTNAVHNWTLFCSFMGGPEAVLRGNQEKRLKRYGTSGFSLELMPSDTDRIVIDIGSRLNNKAGSAPSLNKLR